MQLSFSDARKIRKAFQQEYFPDPAIGACGISQIGLQDKDAPAARHDDYCIVVDIFAPLPANRVLPAEYQGVRIFTQVVAS